MTEAAPNPDLPEPARFSTADHGSPEEALARFRELAAPLCDVTVIGELKTFRVESLTRFLGAAVLIEATSTAMRYDRTPRHVGMGLDHFQLVLYLAGGAEFVADERSYLQRAGDVSLIDMGRPSVTREMQGPDGVAHVISFVLPRLLLAPLIGTDAPAAPIRIVRTETPFGALVRDAILALRRSAAELTPRQNHSAVEALMQLVAGAFGDVEATPGATEPPSHEALRSRIRLHIEENLSVASLGVDTLCNSFDLSRAGLYRLFAPESPAAYIQARRLQRGLAMLLSPAFVHWRIIDIALECQFSSDATFIRAFRRAFGLSPGEARRAASRPGGRPLRADGVELQPDAQAIRWIEHLTGTLLDARRSGPTAQRERR